ncbi:diaminopimelate epimerase [Paenibacillus sp. B01]|uniref:diaminopimelate epimerase n=1 Tax=Paenibacillus sp. B01 TaxID=2660554 RepID=UPI00129B081E|nr:diaminopimelate epimerase [Paenibacillus sp. B01]QGG57827.1 diaminopimelate epimerase [Paenibacillus sp. B01]
MNREIEFVKLSPTQNMTILIRSPLPPEARPAVAARMMAYDSVHAEQVGFIEKPERSEADARLRMAGGEFCGNACMALAALVARERKVNSDAALELRLEASGAEGLVRCEASRIGESYRCRVEMPPPLKVESRTVAIGGRSYAMGLVQYAASTHLLLEVDRFDEDVRGRAAELARLLGAVLDAKLVGILLYRGDTAEMQPLIHVPEVGSLVWERGCGSGAASLGAYLSWKQGRRVELEVRQPGGAIKARAVWTGGEGCALDIEGSVDIVASGTAYVAF